MIRPSKVGLVPCLIILLLWIMLPPPSIPGTPDLEPETKVAAMRALKASAKTRQRRFISGRITGRRLYQEDVYKPERRVMLVTAISPKPCKTPKGSHLTLLSLKNKQDYAREHGHDFYYSAHLSDPQLTGAWNKVALIRDLMHRRSDIDWFVWMDYDALVMDLAYELPWDKYDGYDFVLWGQQKELFQNGDAHMGLNTGVFMVRNTDWARAMFNETSRYGAGNGRNLEPEMKQGLSKYDWALFDQNGFAYVLKHWRTETSRKRVFLENSFTLNGYWKDWPMERVREVHPFVRHFMGCQFCSGINEADHDACTSEFERSFEYADQQAIARVQNIKFVE